MTLKELIEQRMNKNDQFKMQTNVELWQGYCEGWRCAYKDLLEILEQHGFDLSITVIHMDGGAEK